MTNDLRELDNTINHNKIFCKKCRKESKVQGEVGVQER